jgi:hypothetical protein
MRDLRRLWPSEVARCCNCLRVLGIGELHWYDSSDGDLWCEDCDQPAWDDDESIVIG